MGVQPHFEPRWVTREEYEELRRRGALGGGSVAGWDEFGSDRSEAGSSAGSAGSEGTVVAQDIGELDGAVPDEV